jgi:response regulator RpfG family c-di-GMP phosphodiesterase
MEPMNGLEFIEKIRKSPESPNPYVPVILMTGYSDRARVEMARDAGVTEFLMKPYTSKDLYSRIVQIIEKPRQFVDCGTFFGPDRRRRKNFDYDGPLRRTADEESEDSAEEADEKRKVASQILRDLREQTKKI